MKRWRAAAAAVLTVFALPLLSELSGRRLLVFRDAFVTHFPLKIESIRLLDSGVVPFLNFGASHVEPLLPDPNSFSLYPTNLLYFVLAPAAAFNLHLLLHVALAFFGAAALSRRLGAGRAASLIGGAAYSFSGAYLSYAAAFSNSAAAAAWAPWVAAESLSLAAALARGDRRGSLRAVLGTGIAMGLQVLAGEPAVSAWSAVFAAALAAGMTAKRLRPQARLLGAGAAADGCALLLALPQVLPTAAAIPLSFRGEHLFSREQFNAAANVPLRFLEWFFPLVFGSPRPMVSGAFWAYRAFDSLQPYLYSVNVGLACVVLAVSALALAPFRASRVVRGLAALSILFLLLSFGFRTPLFEALYAVPPLRHFRYPIKFVLPFTLGFSALTALAADSYFRSRSSRARTLQVSALGSALILGAGGALALFRPDALVHALEPQFRDMAFPAGAVLPGIFQVVRTDALLGILGMILLAAAGRPGAERRRPALFLAAVLLCLLPAGWPLFVSVPAEPYLREPDLARAVSGRGRLYADLPADFLVARGGARHRFFGNDIGGVILAGRQELWPLTGLSDGVEYAFDKDPDGSYGFLDRVMSEAVSSANPAERARLLRASSARYVLSDSGEIPPGFHRLAARELAGRAVTLFETDSAVPIVRAATRLYTRPSLSGAVELLRSAEFDATRDVVLKGPLHNPNPNPEGNGSPSAVAGTRMGSNSVSAEISSSKGCVAVFAVTFFRYWKAAVDGRPAPVEVANANFCGVRVPAGTHRVEIFYDERPFRWGAAGGGLFLLVAAVILWRSRKQLSRRVPEA